MKKNRLVEITSFDQIAKLILPQRVKLPKLEEAIIFELDNRLNLARAIDTTPSMITIYPIKDSLGKVEVVDNEYNIHLMRGDSGYEFYNKMIKECSR